MKKDIDVWYGGDVALLEQAEDVKYTPYTRIKILKMATTEC